MVDAGVAKKLGIKPGFKLLLLNAPEEHRQALSGLGNPVDTTPKSDASYDTVLGFAPTKADADKLSPAARKAVKPGGVLWMAYPKRSAAKTDITRDTGWDDMYGARWRPVSLVALDETWSALRFRPVEDVKGKK